MTQCMSHFSTLKLFFLLPLHTLLFGRKSRSTHRDWGVMIHLFGQEYLYKLFGNFVHGRFACSLPFIYLFNHLFLSLYAHGYLFYYQCNIICFVAPIVSTLAIGRSLSWLILFSLYPTEFCIVLCLVSSNIAVSWALQDHPSACVFPVSALGSAIAWDLNIKI